MGPFLCGGGWGISRAGTVTRPKADKSEGAGPGKANKGGHSWLREKSYARCRAKERLRERGPLFANIERKRLGRRRKRGRRKLGSSSSPLHRSHPLTLMKFSFFCAAAPIFFYTPSASLPGRRSLQEETMQGKLRNFSLEKLEGKSHFFLVEI